MDSVSPASQPFKAMSPARPLRTGGLSHRPAQRMGPVTYLTLVRNMALSLPSSMELTVVRPVFGALMMDCPPLARLPMSSREVTCTQEAFLRIACVARHADPPTLSDAY